MIKRTLEISREPAHLALQLDQLVLKRGQEIAASVPCEDLGVVVVDHPQTTYTHGALSRLMNVGAVVVICGKNHLPNGLLIPLAHHSEVVWRIRDQMAAPRPLQKRLWQQIVRAKIRAQVGNLAASSCARAKLLQLAREVRSGDAGAHESQAARVYWADWLNGAPPPADGAFPGIVTAQGIDEARFRRDTDGDGLNSLLNYGYAVVRAAAARAIVAAGLHPAIGLQHANRGNPFCLADDLMEPLRPLIDRIARRLWCNGRTQLDQPTKAELLKVLTETVLIDGKPGPLLVGLSRYVASLTRCLRREEKRLAIPRPQRASECVSE